MEKVKLDISGIMKHVPEKLDGRLAMYAVARAAHEMREYMSMTAEEKERKLYESLKQKYEA